MSCVAVSRQRVQWRHRLRSAPAERPPHSVVAIIVPYRLQKEQDRAAQLGAFLQHMAAFFGGTAEETGTAVLVVIAEQAADGRKFNRGQLLNAGYCEAKQHAAPATLERPRAQGEQIVDAFSAA